MQALPVTNKTAGDPESALNHTLETGAGAVQNFAPVQRICAHLNAFHAYAHDATRAAVETNHYCAHVNDDVRQCILYDSPDKGARIIGIEYMIKPHLYDTLDPEEQKLWHTHVFEVKSGMLVMPKPALIPEAAWQLAENAEMEQVVHLYGKIYHLWQTDRGDKLPVGEPQLMTSYTAEEQMPDYEMRLKGRNERFGVDQEEKRKAREYIKVPEVKGEADATWAKGGLGHGGGDVALAEHLKV